MTGKRRRSHGEGSVFKYRDGYAAILDLGWSGDRRRRKWVYGKTERAVLDKLADLRRKQEKGQDLTAAPRTFGEWLDEWIELKSRDGTRQKTVHGYQALIDNHIWPALGKIALDKLSPTMVRRLLAEKSDDGLSAATVRHIHGVIRNALGDAEREELVHRNVARVVRPPALRRPERRTLTVLEAKRLIEVLQGNPMEAFYIAALTVGLRRGELLGLRWSDVDLQEGMLTVRQTVQRVQGRLEFTEPKTDRSRRTVPMPEQTVAALKRHRRRQAEERLAAGEGWQDFGLIFTSRIGTPFDPDNLERSWYKIRAAADLDWLRIHDLRHACATFLLASGASPRTVMKVLGHSQIGLTMNTYAHVLPEIERSAVDAATKQLFG
ncbi:site-specific integrase [Actinoplanes sp. NPDC051633]|uniref:tyrosine-type recombinase/integrase n=1 Tax=Actinoplanes sp. NPDC051633 TaxID=3155670 RepID=UPI003421A192